MIAFLKLIRSKNLLMVLVTMVLTKYALITSYLPTGSLTTIEFIFLSISILFIAAGGYIVNDIYDVEADKINKPHKVFVTNSISIRNAWICYAMLTLIGICFGTYLSVIKSLEFYTSYFVLTAILLLLYSKFLKKTSLIGNLLVSLLVPLVIFLTYQFDGLISTENDSLKSLSLFIIVFYYLLFAFLSTLIRELVKDIEDINGDYASKMKTLPIVLGTKRARFFSLIISVLLLFFMFLILKESILISSWYIFTYIISIESIILIYFIYKLSKAKTKKQFHFLSNLMKFIMLLGILSMGLFKFI